MSVSGSHKLLVGVTLIRLVGFLSLAIILGYYLSDLCKNCLQWLLMSSGKTVTRKWAEQRKRAVLGPGWSK